MMSTKVSKKLEAGPLRSHTKALSDKTLDRHISLSTPLEEDTVGEQEEERHLEDMTTMVPPQVVHTDLNCPAKSILKRVSVSDSIEDIAGEESLKIPKENSDDHIRDIPKEISTPLTTFSSDEEIIPSKPDVQIQPTEPPPNPRRRNPLAFEWSRRKSVSFSEREDQLIFRPATPVSSLHQTLRNRRKKAVKRERRRRHSEGSTPMSRGSVSPPPPGVSRSQSDPEKEEEEEEVLDIRRKIARRCRVYSETDVTLGDLNLEDLTIG